MTDELTDDVKWLRESAEAHRHMLHIESAARCERIADRLEQLAGENAASEEVIETLIQERGAWAKEITALTDERDRLRVALEKYADADNWTDSDPTREWCVDCWTEHDCGYELARTALEKEKP